jgi:hypothetical protein
MQYFHISGACLLKYDANGYRNDQYSSIIKK